MPRGPRLDAAGALQHVMVRGIEKCRIFRSNKDRKDLLRRLAEVIPASGMSVYAWSLLPNHFHLLVRTGKARLSRVMRRLLTGYAVSFNRRHRRVGHLFQNRFKSILVEEEPYFLELVRYIHLNPLRAGLVKSMEALDSYQWTGHSAVMGIVERAWQDPEYVLRRFGGTSDEARGAYRDFVVDGVGEGGRPDLVGGGLIRSIGGRENLVELRRGRERWAYDERVLGSSQFVVGLLEEFEQAREQQRTSPAKRRERLRRLVDVVGEVLGLTVVELTGGSRRKDVVRGRQIVAYTAMSRLGCTAEEVGKGLNVARATVSRGLERGSALVGELGLDVDDLLE